MSERSPESSTQQKPLRKRVLITGSNGIVGSVLTKGFEGKFDIFTFDVAGEVDNEKSFLVDVSDEKTLDHAFSNIVHIDAVIHLAAKADHTTHWKDILKNNIIGTRNLYECARKYGVRRIILPSSTHLFGAYPEYPDKPSGTPIPVDAVHRPDSYYGISKGFGEDFARYYYDEYDIQTIIIRIGSVHRKDVPKKPYHLLWLNHSDTVQIFEAAVNTGIKFGTYYAISADPTIFDIEPTRRDLGFRSRDTDSSKT